MNAELKYTWQRGFSLLELLVVLTVIAVISVVSILGFQGTMRARRVDTGVSLIASKLSEARSNAIKRNRSIRMAINTTTRRVQVFDGTTPLGNPELMPENVRFVGTPPTEITFDSIGRLTTAAQTVTLGYAGSNVSKAVNVAITGKVTVQAMTGS